MGADLRHLQLFGCYHSAFLNGFLYTDNIDFRIALPDDGGNPDQCDHRRQCNAYDAKQETFVHPHLL